MRSNALPVEFEELLTRAGRRVLAGTHELCGALAEPRTRFLARDDLVDRRQASRLRQVLETALVDTLEPLERPIPPESIFTMRPRLSWPLLGATVVSVTLQALVLVPALQPVFHAESLDVHHVVLVAACSVVVLLVVELAKAIDRRRSAHESNDLVDVVRAIRAKP